MPIKPENLDRYPSNWATEIRPVILKRAKNCCERCKARNGTVICREMSGATYMSEDGYIFDAETGDCFGRSRTYPPGRYVTVVLTVAHLDHQPENCDPENLRALCQLCHLNYDKDHHAASRRATLAARKASGDLF